MEQIKIYIELSNELQAVLHDNRISIEDILEEEGIEADVTYGVMPTQGEEEVRNKDIVPIIIANIPEILIASGASLYMISKAIGNVLDAYYAGGHLVVRKEKRFVKDENGKVQLDNEGNPFIEWVEEPVLLEPKAKNRKPDKFLGTISQVILRFISNETVPPQ